jgi:hypothetical protein
MLITRRTTARGRCTHVIEERLPELRILKCQNGRESVNRSTFCQDLNPDPNPDPSKRIVEAGELPQIKVLDHVIVGHQQYCSFRELGQI